MSHKKHVILFKRFERFWHWSQAGLIILLMVTGFRIHGLYDLGVEFLTALRIHTFAAWALVTLWVFAIFWHFTTGEWKQYIPTFDKIFLVARHYAYGMFRGEEHPYHQTVARKHNPLQRLAYLWVKLMINPIIWISGIWLLFFADWGAWPIWRQWGISLQTVAWAHTIGAYMMLIFFIIHVYLTTTGHTPLAHIMAMIRGYEDEPVHHHPRAKAAPSVAPTATLTPGENV
ncbi:MULTISPECIES: cytochrome b/b6 domain-containing protein [unclassified Thiomonas]|uniref:cytochrome b/b6 domain-containing protein n=1 Tax=unclassified Thiomonas TaxID=2625466 RepID=UPI0004DBA4A3|nr:MULTISPECIES: cytochrome b/b6 domain-containing protein [unclassified Thiomonas]CDW94121.1 putative Transmembrane di-heme cytochrome [Thiomonas sp. CB2]VDY04534.1 putative Transmembrane di-heme cytochrome [Thiomonas sp. Bio17B3]VDY08294.1 putative Transmembrane di-heme cytochrome [Thiomonas sp. Sup16B3]VDY12787.1 putative Transmembrane di-heme cytochrome [Thiomonas sp. OC7]VDY18005.1 putative Transmembrane di-heme cytochrome [Thiomonas sp. CB2]